MSWTVVAVIGIMLGFLLLVVGSCVEMSDAEKSVTAPRVRSMPKVKRHVHVEKRHLHRKAA